MAMLVVFAMVMMLVMMMVSAVTVCAGDLFQIFFVQLGHIIVALGFFVLTKHGRFPFLCLNCNGFFTLSTCHLLAVTTFLCSMKSITFSPFFYQVSPHRFFVDFSTYREFIPFLSKDRFFTYSIYPG